MLVVIGAFLGSGLCASQAEDFSRSLMHGAPGESASSSPMASQVQLRSKIGGRGVTDTPCTSPGTCAMLERLSNVCNYGRVGIVAAYQAINIGVHIVSMLTTLLCACLNVLSFSFCILKVVTPICVLVNNFYGGLFSNSVGLWESVKGNTKTCIMHGFPLISSMR